MRRGRKSSWEELLWENNGLLYQRRRESEECENRDKRIVMMELIIQE
jgi:hypothetical protein